MTFYLKGIFMGDYEWRLQEPLDAVVFDCDGTLSEIEGIDVLAEENGVAQEVERLTQEAMSVTGITENIYHDRLQYTKPTRQQLEKLGEVYYQYRSEHVESVIEIFQDLGKKVFVLSAGMNPAVKIFSDKLGVNVENVYAVDLEFDKDGNYCGYHHYCAPSRKGGKCDVLEDIKKNYPRIMHVGDGMNDVEAKDSVTRFVGYGGAYFRQSIMDLCEFYIKSKSLLPLLHFGLTIEELTHAKIDPKIDEALVKIP